MGDWRLGDIFTLALFAGTLRVALPYFLAALGATFSERGGVINLGLEGMMLGGAFGYVLAAHAASDLGPVWAPVAGVAAGMLVGVGLAALLGLATIYLRAEQIVSGLAINILVPGVTRYLLQKTFGSSSNSGAVASIKPWEIIPADWAIAPLNTLFHPILIASVVLLVALRRVLYHSRFGLRLRAVGEHPLAAETLGVAVLRTRLWGVLISGALAALAGVYLAAEQGLFVQDMTGGRGYIALAVMILGKWRPGGALVAALVFGFAEALADRLQTVGGIVLPLIGDLSQRNELIQMVPYVLTLAVMAGFIGGAPAPAAVGQPYTKERAR